MNKKILLWSITAALAGFLFGFDVVVISGADKKLQAIWQSSDSFHGWVVMGAALWGTVIGAIFGGIPTNTYGRKNTLLVIGVLFAVSAIGSAFSSDPYLFAFARFIGGVGVGASTIAAPAYISEIAPAKDRGRLVAMYQFNIVFGILIAFLSNFLLSGLGENAWRWMLGVEAIPAVIYILFVLKVPKSPRWLLSKSRNEEAEKVLMEIDPNSDVKTIISEFNSHSDQNDTSETIFIKKVPLPVNTCFSHCFFQSIFRYKRFSVLCPQNF